MTLLLFLPCTLLIHFVTHSEGTPCKFTVTSHGNHVTASCSGLLLTSIPTSLPDDVTRLDLSHNSISNLSNLIFRRFQQLQVLDLRDNALSSDLDVDVFVPLDKLEVLDLSHNNITTFSCRHTTVGTSKRSWRRGGSRARQQRGDLNTVSKLHTSTAEGSHPGLKSLRVLRLDFNALKAVCFKGLSSLSTLTLSNNLLNTIPSDTFNDFTQLETLNLDANHLQHLNSRSFNELTNLKTLSMAYNKLQYTNASFPPGLFAAMGDTLTSLYLHGNDNNAVTDGTYPEAAFSDLSALETLKIDSFPSVIFGEGFAAMRKLNTLDLSQKCRLHSLSNRTFLSFTNGSLRNILIDTCKSFSRIEACVFCPLSDLTTLKLSVNSHINTVTIDLTNALQAFYAFQFSSEVAAVDLNTFAKEAPRGVRLDRKSMKFVLNTCVKTLNLNHNGITSIARTALWRKGSRFKECIQSIDLSRKRIHFTSFFSALQFLANSPRLETIQWQLQDVFTLEEAIYTLGIRKPHKTHPFPIINLKYKLFIRLPALLTFANFSGGFHAQSLPDQIVFEGAENIKTSDISYVDLYGCTTKIEGFEHLETLILSGNDCRNTLQSFFDAFPELRTLILQNMNFEPGFFMKHGARIFANLSRLGTLDLSLNVLDLLPSDLLHVQTGLHELLLSGNKLSRLSLDVHHHGNLTVLDLSDNDLSQLNDTEQASLDAVVAKQSQPFQLRLHGNPLACTCNTLSFVRWLRSTRIRLDRDGDYPCVTDSGQLSSTATVADHWESAWRRCVGPTVLWAAVAGMLLLLSLTGAVWGVAANATRLRFLFGVFRRIKMSRRQQFVKDVYVAYCDTDTEFVCTRLKAQLQERRGVHLLIKDLPRDVAGTQFWQLPGDNVAEKMLGHIDLCWKVLLVITPALPRDPMAGFMMRAVLQSITDRMPDRVLLLCVGVRHVPALASLRAVLDSVSENQVFFVPEEADQRHPAWDRMADVILT